MYLESKLPHIQTFGKVHGNFHVPCDETYGKVHRDFHVPCDETYGMVNGNFHVPCDEIYGMVHGNKITQTGPSHRQQDLVEVFEIALYLFPFYFLQRFWEIVSKMFTSPAFSFSFRSLYALAML